MCTLASSALIGFDVAMLPGTCSLTQRLKAFTLGLITLSWQPLPNDFVLLVHLSLVIILMLIFPFSKLLHAPGIFFSPTRNMRDNPREHRHVASWAKDLPKSADRTDGS